jgi:hypothetical protein
MSLPTDRGEELEPEGFRNGGGIVGERLEANLLLR